MPGFAIATTDGAAGTVIAVTGSLDARTCGALRDEVRRAPRTGPRVIDLTGCTLIDSHGVAVLIGAYQYSRAHECPLGIALGDGKVMRLLELTGLRGVLAIRSATEATEAGKDIPDDRQ
jgi:anti-anti-sigma factor